jgi:hypothetical protein
MSIICRQETRLVTIPSQPVRRSRSRMRAVTDDETPQPTTHDEPIDGEELTDEERRVLANVAGILRKIKYGTVVLVVQDGKVVQIEMAEKFRLR